MCVRGDVPLCAAGMGMSQVDAVAGGRRPVVKGNMGVVDDIDLDDDDVRSSLLLVLVLCS